MALSSRIRQQTNVESLEGLILMSASAVDSDADLTLAGPDESLEPAPYQQILTLNDGDNDAILEDNGDPDDDLLQIRSLNDSFETIVFRKPTDSLVIELGAGNDSLKVDGQSIGQLASKLFVYGQGGDDLVNLDTLNTTADVFVDDQQGDNTLETRRLTIGGNLFLNDGDGEQTARIIGNVAGDISIYSSGGGSTIDVGVFGIEPTVIDGSVTINNMGEGVDDVELGGRIRGDVYIDASDGDFGLRSIFQNIGGSVNTYVGQGNSTIFLGDFAAGGSSFNTYSGDTDIVLTQSIFSGGLSINNGDGFDQLRLDGTRISGSDGMPGFLDVRNGDGGSRTTINEFERVMPFQVGEFHLTNGAGEDTLDIRLRDKDFLGALYVNNGDGDSTVGINGTGSIETASFHSGTGTDTFTIDGVDIEGELFINSGEGDRTVDIQNSTIGNTSINGSAPEMIVYGDGDDEIFASLGNNMIDGGDGEDVLVVYEGTSADFTITYEDDGRVIVEGPGLNGTTVRNELVNVEQIRFLDQTVYLNEQGGGEPPVTLGTDGDDWISVPERGGKVDAGAGNDEIYAPLSEFFNEIDGGDGVDTLIIYEGVRADYTIRRAEDDSLELEGPGLNGTTVINRLTNVEFVHFLDGKVSVAELESGL